MRIDILTLFPEMFSGVLNESMLGRAAQKGILEFHLHNIRDYSSSKHKNADDYPFGGGAGMVMMPQPIFDCLDAVDKNEESYRVVLAPRGEPLSVNLAKELAQKERLLFLCGHYEGIDERSMGKMHKEVSIGDYVLTGGELPAMVVIDCVSRFIPGVLGSEESAQEESFSEGLLEYPQYTRPSDFRGETVPDVLLNGNHAAIAKWRRERSIETTLKNRPELLESVTLSKAEKLFLESLKTGEKPEK